MKCGKRCMLILLVCLLVFPAFSADATTASNEGKYSQWWDWCVSPAMNLTKKRDSVIGDVNFNGKIDAADALWVLEYAVEGNAYQWLEQPLGFDYVFEKNMEIYYKKGIYNNKRISKVVQPDMRFYYYFYNSSFLADTTNDLRLNAADALEILQYAVGLRNTFTRTDFSGSSHFCYCPWPEDWEPGMIWNEDIEEKTSSGYYSPFQ